MLNIIDFMAEEGYSIEQIIEVVERLETGEPEESAIQSVR